MIVINLTLQFLPVEQRLALLKKCHNALVQGGVLILTEKTHLNNEQDDAWRVERYYDFKRANGYSELEISGKRTALENVLITDTLEAHHQRLAMAGFERSMTWFQFPFSSSPKPTNSFECLPYKRTSRLVVLALVSLNHVARDCGSICLNTFSR